jgi:hypothetical protein
MSYEIIYQTFTVMQNGLFKAYIIVGSNNEFYSTYGRGKSPRGRNYHIINKEFLPRNQVETLIGQQYDKIKDSDSYRIQQKTREGFIKSFFIKTFKPEEVLEDSYRMDKQMSKTVGTRPRIDYVQVAMTKPKQSFNTSILPSLVGKRVVFYNRYESPVLVGKLSQIGTGYGVKISSRRYRPLPNFIETYTII